MASVPSPLPAPPRWLDEIDLTLSICAQYTLYGNIRDTFVFPRDGRSMSAPLNGALWSRLQSCGFEALLLFSRHEGLQLYGECDSHTGRAIAGGFGAPGDPGDRSLINQLPRIIGAVSAEPGLALVIEDASRLVLSPRSMSEAELTTFAGCVREIRKARPRAVAQPSGSTRHLYSPVFWLIDQISDLPEWVVVGDERMRAISVALPDRETRLDSARRQMPSDPDGAAAERIAALTDQLMLREVGAVATISRDRGIGVDRIADAVRAYTVGVADNPWGQTKLKADIASAEEKLKKEVIGQDAAVNKALDVLKSSVLGLHGAQTASSSRRPRGALFFAGPTGVGKTELAKAMSRLIFGDSDDFFRLDMSEFAAEHSEARLIGAPPGYVGHDQGGELVNAVRERPFRIILFDEIEKAHGRILDKFLQILEDGRLTDGRGDTVYFSEALLVFTSNLGIMADGPDGKPVTAVTTKDLYPAVREKVEKGIHAHFIEKLKRPELLNRLGENIVVFDFIRDEPARRIFAGMLANVVSRVRSQCGIELKFDDGLEARLRQTCIETLEMGARGIGNQIEERFVKPLTRALFADSRVDPAREVAIPVHIAELDCSTAPYRVTLR